MQCFLAQWQKVSFSKEESKSQKMYWEEAKSLHITWYNLNQRMDNVYIMLMPSIQWSYVVNFKFLCWSNFSHILIFSWFVFILTFFELISVNNGNYFLHFIPVVSWQSALRSIIRIPSMTLLELPCVIMPILQARKARIRVWRNQFQLHNE